MASIIAVKSLANVLGGFPNPLVIIEIDWLCSFIPTGSQAIFLTQFVSK